jgi:tetratricopeptide (TPR) repeat protein
LIGLQRFHEAIPASKEALRLSDGKYSSYHFTLADAYFELENWQLAKQSYEKAAELNPKSFSAAYNVGLCYVKLGFYRDGARWYEEALKRDPNNAKRADILRSIEALRR